VNQSATDSLKPYPAYKDSGVPWVGDVPEHWEFRRMKTLLLERVEKGFPKEPLLAATQTKGVVRKEQYENRTVLALKDLHLLKLVRRGDFVISLRSFQGGIEFARDQGIISPAYTVLYPVDFNNHDYLVKLFKSKPYIENLSLYVTGIRQGQNIDYEKLSRSELPVPPQAEQTAIVRFLDHADRRINLFIRTKQKLIKLLEEQKKAIIHQAVTRGLDPNVQLKPSGVEWLGDVPIHWHVVAVGSSMSLIQTGPFGSQLHSHEYIIGGTPVINPSQMVNGQIISSSEITVSKGKSHELHRHKLCTGDIVVARRGEIGRCALVTPVEHGWICGTGSLLLRGNPSMFLPAYFQHIFSSRCVRDALSLFSVGSTMSNLNAGIVARLKLTLPPQDEQKQIVFFVECQNNKCDIAISRLEQEIAFVCEYRTRLVADVVTGKIDVREAAALLPDECENTRIEDEVDILTEEEGEEAENFETLSEETAI
jgi:type I restriction enzyme S subunit